MGWVLAVSGAFFPVSAPRAGFPYAANLAYVCGILPFSPGVAHEENPFRSVVFFAALVILLGPVEVSAQTTATSPGTVTDQSGGLIVGAQITIPAGEDQRASDQEEAKK